MFLYFVFHIFNNQKGRGKSKTIVGEIPTIDFTFFSYFLPYKMGVLNEKRCNITKSRTNNSKKGCEYMKNNDF